MQPQAPVSNSSGSVVNQAVQITPGQYMKYSVGSGIQCDGATLNISPFASTTHSFGNPNNQYYQEPVYDNSDNFGLIDPETGLDGPDGIPDNPGMFCTTNLRGQATARTSVPTSASQQRSQSHSTGGRSISAKTRSGKQVALYEQALADKRLNYEMGRLKAVRLHCVRVMASSKIRPSFPICADVVLKPKAIQDHTHKIIYPKPASDREWLDSGDAESPAAAVKIPVLPYGQASD